MARRPRNDDHLMQGAYIETVDQDGMGFLPRLLPFICGILLGLAAAAFLFAHPYVIGLALEQWNTRVGNMSEEKQQLIPVVTALVGIALLILARKIIFGSAAFWGLLVGGFLWVPFGNHMLSVLPQIEDSLPSLRNGVDDYVASSERMTGVRTWAERTFPVPGAGEETEAAEALPQIEN